MMYDEFCNMVRDLKPQLACPEYEDFCNTIEPVYLYHPADIEKIDMAKIYCMNGGIRIIKSLLPESLKIRDIHDQIDMTQARYDSELDRLHEQLERAMEG